MISLKKKLRLKPEVLFPLVRKTRPRRCDLSGMTEKHQLPWPPPWRRGKNFNNPKYYPLEIDHRNEDATDSRTSNLGFKSKVYHIEKTISSWKFVMRRKKRRG